MILLILMILPLNIIYLESEIIFRAWIYISSLICIFSWGYFIARVTDTINPLDVIEKRTIPIILTSIVNGCIYAATGYIGMMIIWSSIIIPILLSKTVNKSD